jgi:hypothetical protein
MMFIKDWKKDYGKTSTFLCKWEIDPHDEQCIHHTSCGEAHCFVDGDVQDNQYKFCPFCGNEIKEIKKEVE